MRTLLLLLAAGCAKHAAGDGCPDGAYHHAHPAFCAPVPVNFDERAMWDQYAGVMFERRQEIVEIKWPFDRGAGAALLAATKQPTDEDTVITVERETPTSVIVRATSIFGQTSVVRFFAASWAERPAQAGILTCAYTGVTTHVNPGEPPPSVPANAAVCEGLRALHASEGRDGDQ